MVQVEVVIMCGCWPNVWAVCAEKNELMLFSVLARLLWVL